MKKIQCTFRISKAELADVRRHVRMGKNNHPKESKSSFIRKAIQHYVVFLKDQKGM